MGIGPNTAIWLGCRTILVIHPQILDLLRSWREDLGGVYNPKYRNWIFPPDSQEEILNRLKYLDQ